ncbi:MULTISPECIES: GGDEF domain-containing protein [Halomonadaceae]|uniref:sensor domain-containing diguanylate cyclase n=1 Tax=Halomonadaceae TaxID=28256 RepID=UPI00159A63AA|nr:MULTISPECIES: GGDEF domain-containing protein [Halomonas]QJQ96304.1 GGDEF domain-containing protein [Halomonas sp. PA5]
MLPYALRQSLENCTQLPSLPTVVLRVIELARDPDACIRDIVTTIGSDPALAVRLLSLANTVYYANHTPVEDLQQAVNRIGIERTLSLALGCSLVSASDNESAQGLNLEHYWQRSLLCALNARSLAESLGLEAESGVLFTASLLQDIGMLAIHAVDGEQYQPLLDQADHHRALVALETRTYETDHAEVGGWLTEQWQLSARTSQWIRHSHGSLIKPESREQKAQNCIIAAGLLADAWLSGEAALSETMASLEPYFGLESAEMIAKIMTLQEQLPAVATLYNISLPERLDPNQLMFEAKLLLAERNARLQQDVIRQQQEIEALRRQQELLSRQVHTDALTRLDNRLHLERCLKTLFERAGKTSRPLSVIFIDLDRFKEINDGYGHNVGDEVLKRFADILRESVKEHDFHAGRYGGEEFLVLLPDQPADEAQRFAELLRCRVGAEPLAHVLGTPILVTASYGIAAVACDTPFDHMTELLEAADRSMYQSKHEGGDRITVFPSLAASLN